MLLAAMQVSGCLHNIQAIGISRQWSDIMVLWCGDVFMAHVQSYSKFIWQPAVNTVMRLKPSCVLAVVILWRLPDCHKSAAAGSASPGQGGHEARGKKRLRQDTDDEESTRTISDNEKDDAGLLLCPDPTHVCSACALT